MQVNADIRQQAKTAKVPLWAIAKYLNISEATMTRKMRVELSEDEEQQVLDAIRSISGKREARSYAEAQRD